MSGLVTDLVRRRTPADAAAAQPSLDQVLEEVAEGAPVAVHLDASPRLLSARCPADVADALRRALGEALRNVERHSGVRRASLEVQATGDGTWRVAVVDRGRGFPAQVRHGYGLEHSLHAPVVAVGGSVSLQQTPGGGATVVLSVPAPDHRGAAGPRPWSDERLQRTYHRTVLTSGGSISLVRAVAWPQGAVWTYLAVKYSLRTPSPWLLLALTTLLVGVTALVAIRLEHRPPTRRWVGAVWAVLVAAQLAGLVLLPAGGMLDYRSWPIGFVAVPVMTLCMFLPRSLALVVALPHPLLILLANRLDPALADGQLPVGSLNASLLTALLGIAIGDLLRRTSKLVEEERDRLSQAERALARRRARAEVTSLHLEHTRHVVVPWLERVGSGRVDLDEPATAARARTLSLEVRDDLYAPGLFDPALRRLVSAARSRGAVVEVGAGFAPGASDRTTGLLLRELVPHLRHGAKLTVATRDAHSRISLVPPDHTLVARAHAVVGDGLVVDADDFRVVLRFLDHPGNRGVDHDRDTH